MNRFVLFVLLAISSLALAQENGAGEERPRLSAEVLWQMDRVGSPIISPDGSQVVVAVTSYDMETDKASTRLWLLSPDGDMQRPLTAKGLSVSSPTFSPGGETLAFVSSRDEDEAGQIYLLPMQAPGEATRLSELPTGAGSLKWVGEHIYFISRIWPEQNFEQMAEQIKSDKDSKMSAHTWNALPYSFFDHWLDEDRQAHVFRIPAAGGEVENLTLASGLQLSRSSQSTSSYDVAPDESLLAVVSDSKNSGTRPDMDVFLLEIRTADASNLTQGNAGPDGNPMFSPDGQLLAFNRQHIPGFYGDARFLMLHELATGNTRLLHDEWDRSADGLIWSPDSAGLFGAIDDAATRRVYFLPISGSAPVAITGDTSFSGLSIADNGNLVATNQSFLYPPRVVRIDPESRAVTRLDTFNDELLSNVDLGTYESVTYTGADGADIQMWVHYPPGFDERQEYPLFLLIHGGPHG
ncbi:MAG: S9 family peptidase, partial [Pseudomonadota bacterium]